MTPKSMVACGIFLLPLLGMGQSAKAAAPTTAFGIIDDMGVGWNLGNALDASGGETGWGNPRTTQRMIDTVRAAGFKTLRVPVRWDENLSGTGHTIATAWMDRVEQVVNYGLNDGMYVILNIHHNNGWEDPTAANAANAQDYLTKIWAQIAARFQKYDNHLIFETMNEPTVTTNGSTEWAGKTEYYNVINQLNAVALTTIRATGGNNASRLVMMPGYAANSDGRIQNIVLPKDSMLAVSVHSYAPLDFCLTVPGVSTFTGTSSIDYMYSIVSSTFVKKGIPAILGEWGAVDKNNVAERVKYAAYVSKFSKPNRIPIILWDDGGTMGNLKRSGPTWNFPTIIQAIMAGTGTTPVGIETKSHPVEEGLKIHRSANGIRFTSPVDCNRFVLTGLDGRSTMMSGGRTGFLPAGNLRPGVYMLRAETANGSLLEKVVIGQ